MARSKRTRALWCWALTLALSALVAPQPLSAQSSALSVPRLTDHGRWLISGSAGGAYAEGVRGSSSPNWFVRVAPSATYFVRDRIGVGLALNGGVGENTSGSYSLRNSELGTGAIGTFEVALSSRLGILFRPFLGYVHQWRRITRVHGAFGPGAQVSAPGALIQQQAALANAMRPQQLGSLRAALGMELLLHLSPHVGLAAGPEAWFDWLFDDGVKVSYRTNAFRLQVGLSVSLLFGI